MKYEAFEREARAEIHGGAKIAVRTADASVLRRVEDLDPPEPCRLLIVKIRYEGDLVRRSFR